MSFSSPKARRWRRLLVSLLLLGTLGAGGTYGWRELYPSEKTTYMTRPVTLGSIEETVLANGILKPVNLVAVGAQVSGQIVALHVDLGDEVKEGDLIAEIDSVTQLNALRTAEAALANVRAQLAEKQATLTRNRLTLKRSRAMIAERAVSQADLESAEADVRTTEAQIEALKAQIVEAEVAVETADANLGYTSILAPSNGTVLAIVSKAGQTVNAAQSAPTIVILGQLDRMDVRAEISEADILHVEPGQKVYFTVLGDPDRRYDAVLESIEPAPESIRSDSSLSTSSSTSSSSSSSTSSSAIYYIGSFRVPNPERKLRTYMTAEVHIQLNSVENVLTVPAAALGRKGRDGKFEVRVLGAGDAVETRQVNIGLNNKVRAEVIEGLAEGEKVVVGQSGGAAASSQRRFRMRF
ncbi:efflux RND transporter periplasmic adaptor subunit [Nisaea acidiphila]|uniref:Efflux RND transporter periplasmic adaptor subunit n=1 Tax=Nisaea acidiphila TaxID=1862145 RepID=A0A9J7AZA5_9PROT|nr:efflux RND transporter periplasmic adaptor subunit [Nisaea acidiphila]UUX51588.1 efflux RND transporter periplasmic adaptor subunit [Nisaea acidiphila]